MSVEPASEGAIAPPPRGGPVRGVHRIVFGKRVARPGGPTLSSDHEITSVSAGFPDGLRPSCLAGALSAGADARELLHPQAPEAGGFSLRPAQAEGIAYVLAERLALRPEDGAEAAASGRGGRRHAQAEVWAFEADAFSVEAPKLLSALPELVAAEPEAESGGADGLARLRGLVSPEWSEADLDGAGRLAAALISETELAPFTRADFPDEQAFWRAIAVLSGALPIGLRPLLSASDGLRAPIERPLLRYLPQAAGAAHGRGAPDALEQIRRRLDGAWSVGWRTAEDAAADLRNLIQDAADAEAQRSLKRFLIERDAPPAPPPEDPHHHEVYLRRLIAAAHTGAAFRSELPDFGRARALGLIASATDTASEPAWDYIRRTQPGRLFWGAFLLSAPNWFEPEPIQTLRNLSRLLSFDARVRSALPPGAATPADGPAFKARLRRLAGQGAKLLTLDPGSLVDEDRDLRDGASESAGEPEDLEEVSAWVRLRPDLFAELPASAREEVSQALDAIEAAAHVFAADAPLLAAAARIRRVSLGERGARSPQLEDARTPLDFAERWMKAIEAGARGGAGFWKAAFERWFETVGERDSSPLDALIAFRRRLQADRASHGAVARALEAATQRFASRRVAAADPAVRLFEALTTWRRLWIQGGASAAAAARAPLYQAAEEAGAADAAISRGAGQVCAQLVVGLARREEGEFADRATAAIECGLEALAVFRRLWVGCPPETLSGLREECGHVLRALDAAASLADPRSGTAALDVVAAARPAQAAALLDAAMTTVLGWSAGAEASPVWPAERGGALVKGVVRATGGALALYVGGYPGARSAPAVGEGPPRTGRGDGAEGPGGWAAWIADHGLAADRALAINALTLWRRRFAEALQARDEDDAAGDPAAATLSPFPAQEADALALEAIGRLVGPAEGAARAELDGLLGADAVWTLKQFLELGRDAKERAGHEAAPRSVRAAWSRIAYAKERKDLFDEEMFFLFLASRLAAGGARSMAAGAPVDPISGPFLAMLRDSHYAQRSAVGVLMNESKNALKTFLWQRPGSDERAAAIEALEDAEVAARLDRGLLFLALTALDETDPPAQPDLRRLWAPLRVGAKEIQRLHPAPRLIERLSQFLHEDPNALAEEHRHYRQALEKVVLHSFSLNKFQVWRTLLFNQSR